jgi:putative endonuclease
MTFRRLVDRLLRKVLSPRGLRYRGSRGAGQRWERLAEKHLKAAGFTLRERNVRGRFGEIDLVAEENGVLCFVEVKAKSGPRFGAPVEAVTLEKQRRIARAAQEYLARRRSGPVPCRFDVVAIRESPEGAHVEIVRGAFEAPDPDARRRR